MKTKKHIAKLLLICVIFSFSCFGKENARIYKHNDSFTQENREELFRKQFPGKFTKEKYVLRKPAAYTSERSSPIIFVAPDNDNFVDRITISGDSGTINGSNYDASMEPDEPMITPFGNVSNSVWWTWECPASGMYGFDTIGSDFNTVLGIFTGESLSGLQRVVYGFNITYFDNTYTNQSYVTLNAVGGQKYQMAVAGAPRSADWQGNITLNWYLDTLVTCSNNFYTNNWKEVFLANNGSALDANYTSINNNVWKTNVKEIIIIKNLQYGFYSNLDITDKKNRKLVQNGSFDLSGDLIRIFDFDGKHILVKEQKNDEKAKNLHLYSVSKKGLKKINEYIISNNFATAWLSEKWIYVVISEPSGWGDAELLALDKKLGKIVWKFVPSVEGGGFRPIYPKGVAAYSIWGISNVLLEVTKKGKPYGTLTLPYPDSGFFAWRVDSKGGILYWYLENGTNGPMTYVDRKGKKVVGNFMPDNFSTFKSEQFSGKMLCLYKSTAGTADIQTYKWGKNPKLNGETSIAGFKKSCLDRTKLYIVTTNSGNISVTEYDKKLEKVKWENTGEGININYLGKKVFSRKNTNATSQIFTIFKKKKIVAEHIIDY